ncbi:transcriptional regulator [Nocardioides sp. KR10-350]|uniref:transcriptional regulator n=1 Tax=Nocardioides cheoyonin TaxID=3156615 RepID=UPI0032B31B54
MQLEQVQKYVMSSLLCSVVLLHSLAMAVLGVSLPNKGGSRPGLFVISVLLGVVAITGVRLINKLRIATPWLVCALVIPVAVYVVAPHWG